LRIARSSKHHERKENTMTVKKIAVLIGSLRKQSFNRKMALAVSALAPAALQLEIVEIGDLPLYNEELDADGAPPAAWTAFRQTMQGYDGVLFCTAEYNRSVPAVLKNALDVGSRPYGASIWNGKPGAIISVSPGALGGFGANHHLRQSLMSLNVPCMQQPEAYIGGAGALFAPDGSLSNDATRQFMQKFINAFATWVEHNG